MFASYRIFLTVGAFVPSGLVQLSLYTNTQRWASSAGIISLLFIFVAYQPGVENQTASSLGGITAMETLLPALFHLLLAG